MTLGTETREVRLKRLRMRSMRRGTKEMDLILIGFSERRLAKLEPEDLDAYEHLLEQNDQDLYGWITGQVPAPPAHAAMVDLIRADL